MNPQRRTALISVGAAAALVALKLTVGITTNSLGLLSEALHSGTDLIAALLTFFAIGIALPGMAALAIWAATRGVRGKGSGRA